MEHSAQYIGNQLSTFHRGWWPTSIEAACYACFMMNIRIYSLGEEMGTRLEKYRNKVSPPAPARSSICIFHEIPDESVVLVALLSSSVRGK